jgi:DTW domain-containing protein YfiP
MSQEAEFGNMTVRFKRNDRCMRCRMHEGYCFCSEIPTFALQTRVVLIIHRTEIRKPSATGPLALEVLSNSEMRVHGYQEAPLDVNDLFVPDRRVVLMFPRENAPALDRSFLDADKRPLTLVFPDGNWGQASRMARRIPGMSRAETAVLPRGQRTRWGLRREPHEEGLATFEAIARSVGLVESPTVQNAMESLFDLMVERTRMGWRR